MQQEKKEKKAESEQEKRVAAAPRAFQLKEGKERSKRGLQELAGLYFL